MRSRAIAGRNKILIKLFVVVFFTNFTTFQFPDSFLIYFHFQFDFRFFEIGGGYLNLFLATGNSRNRKTQKLFSKISNFLFRFTLANSISYFASLRRIQFRFTFGEFVFASRIRWLFSLHLSELKAKPFSISKLFVSISFLVHLSCLKHLNIVVRVILNWKLFIVSERNVNFILKTFFQVGGISVSLTLHRKMCLTS